MFKCSQPSSLSHFPELALINNLQIPHTFALGASVVVYEKSSMRSLSEMNNKKKSEEDENM